MGRYRERNGTALPGAWHVHWNSDGSQYHDIKSASPSSNNWDRNSSKKSNAGRRRCNVSL
jgi:hypothetical protein